MMAGEPRVLGQPGIYSKTLSQKKQHKKKKKKKKKKKRNASAE
jgi:hypothetical protein